MDIFYCYILIGLFVTGWVFAAVASKHDDDDDNLIIIVALTIVLFVWPFFLGVIGYGFLMPRKKDDQDD